MRIKLKLRMGKKKTEATEDEVKPFVESSLQNITNAMIHENEGVQWIAISPDPKTETVSVTPMDTGIYGGRGGLALLFERASRIFNSTQYLDIARASFYQEIQALQRGEYPLLTPSGMLHLSGLMLGFWKIGSHDGHGDLRDHAMTLISELGPRSIERDFSYDVIAGSAGMILVLDHIAMEESNPIITERIESLARHLVAKAGTEHGGPSWGSASGPALAGFSHGMCGIGLALLHAYRHTGIDEFRDVALGAFACEDRLRSDTYGNWADLRVAAQKGIDFNSPGQFQMQAWCHGLPGIMLGRAAALQIEDSPIIRDGYDFARANWKDMQLQRHHLCCGSSGISEIQRTTGVLMQDDDLIEASKQTLMYCLGAIKDGDATFTGEGMMQGSAGPAWAAMGTLDPENARSHIMLCKP